MKTEIICDFIKDPKAEAKLDQDRFAIFRSATLQLTLDHGVTLDSDHFYFLGCFKQTNTESKWSKQEKGHSLALQHKFVKQRSQVRSPVSTVKGSWVEGNVKDHSLRRTRGATAHLRRWDWSRRSHQQKGHSSVVVHTLVIYAKVSDSIPGVSTERFSGGRWTDSHYQSVLAIPT